MVLCDAAWAVRALLRTRRHEAAVKLVVGEPFPIDDVQLPPQLPPAGGDAEDDAARVERAKIAMRAALRGAKPEQQLATACV